VEYLKENITLTGIKNYLKKTHVTKKSGEKFTCTDVQGYIRRERLPAYLGGNEIQKSPTAVTGAKLYNIVK
jgi:hypothetical protein